MVTKKISGAAKAPAAKKTSAKTPPTAPRKRAAPVAKVAQKAAAKPAKKAAKPAAPAAPAEPKRIKPKLVRDSFTIPKTEYAVLTTLKQRAVQLGQQSKKSELLRAGIKALAAMADADFLKAVGAVPAIKTGRPKGKLKTPEA